jgi:hypothetical protein
MIAFTINCRDIVNNIYIPKYYDPELHSEITMLRDTHDCLFWETCSMKV